MGLFKKPTPQIDNDEEIRREIRARVAKQAGIYDEEYINTGKIGGNKTGSGATDVDKPADAAEPSHVSAAAVPIVGEKTERAADEPAPTPAPVQPQPEPAPQAQPKPLATEKSAPQVKPKPVATEKPSPPPKPVKEKKQPKPPKQPKEKQPKPPKQPKEKQPKTAKATKKKKKNVAMILFIILLLFSFIPLYYYLTGGSNHAPEISASGGASDILLGEPLVIQGMVSDVDDEPAGVKVYYSVDSGSATLFYTFDAGPGPFEAEIKLPDSDDFVGEHTISLYAKDTAGKLSESTSFSIKVAKPVLMGLTITTAPTKVKYTVGDSLDLTGLVVTASYEGDKTLPVTTYTADKPSGTKLTQAGEIPVVISYMEDNVTKTATFNVSVAKAATIPVRQVNTSYPVPSLEVFMAGPGAADLQWNLLSGVSGYQIQRKTGSSGSWSTVKTLSSGYSSWTDTGPSSGRTYYYRICSYKVVGGEKVYSNFSTARSVAL